MGTFDRVVDAAKNYACSLYKEVPRALIPNAADAGLRMIWDDFCKPPNQPPPPEMPFVGGQCCDVLYQVKVSITTGAGTTVSTYNGIYGTVKGIEIINWGADQLKFFLVSQRCSGQVVKIDMGTNYKPATRKITQVIRQDGKPDNCGNPPKEYPPIPPVDINNFESNPTSITLNDNSTHNLTFKLIPPVRIPTLKDLFPPIQIIVKDPVLKFEMPFNFNFNGTLNIGGGGGGDGFNSSDRDTINNIKNTTTAITNNTTNIDNSITNITKRDRNEPIPASDFDPSPTPKPPGDHDVERLFAVEVQLTTVPKNAKKQFGAGSPNVVYAGWFEWKRKGFVTPREPIHFEKTVFLAPVGVEGFAYTLYNGFQGSATPVINKEVAE